MNFKDWSKQQPVILFDSSMGLGLKQLGFDVDNQLWTAKALITDPQKVYEVNKAYFDSGSNVASTDSYQASLQGFLDAGYTKQQAKKWIESSVTLAQKARQTSHTPQAKWIAGAIGPYGAYLADGSEYRGDYQVNDDKMAAFHIDRIKWLVEAGSDLLAIKTIPNWQEIKVICTLLRAFPDVPVYFSCSLKDAHHISDGTDLKIVQNYLAQQPSIIAYGFNCFHPRYADEALKYIKTNQKDDKGILVAPNAGGHYDPEFKQWGTPIKNVFSDNAPKWHQLGANWIGGCCEMPPQQMKAVREELFSKYRKDDQ